MQLTILQVQALGSEESLRLTVTDHCNLQHYMIADTTYSAPGCISNKRPHLYWFPDHTVAPDDQIVLHTASGADHTSVTLEGQTEHHFYWNLNTPVWNDTGDHATLFHLNQWHTQAVGHPKDQCANQKPRKPTSPPQTPR